MNAVSKVRLSRSQKDIYVNTSRLTGGLRIPRCHLLLRLGDGDSTVIEKHWFDSGIIILSAGGSAGAIFYGRQQL